MTVNELTLTKIDVTPCFNGVLNGVMSLCSMESAHFSENIDITISFLKKIELRVCVAETLTPRSSICRPQ